MTHLAPEDPLAALREEIRSIAWHVWFIRFAVGCAGLCLLVVPLILFFGSLTGAEYDDATGVKHEYPANPIHGAIAGGVGVLATVTVSLPAAAGYRTLRRRLLAKRLRSEADAPVAALLLSMQRESSREVRRLIHPIIGDLGLPTELTPAETPEGSGAEVVGVDSVRVGRQ